MFDIINVLFSEQIYYENYDADGIDFEALLRAVAYVHGDGPYYAAR